MPKPKLKTRRGREREEEIEIANMALASLLKSSPSPVLDKSEWAKGQSLRAPSAATFPSSSPSTLTVRASYADELVKTAVWQLSS